MGYSPTEAMRTPISLIYLALDSRVDYLRKTSVLRGGPPVDQKPKTAEDVADKVKRVMRGFGNGNRTK